MTDYSHIIYFSGVHQATQVLDCWLSSHGQHGWHGCPQADGVGEHESSEFKRNLNGGPQADDGVERKLSGINRELKEMGPQADDISGQQSPAIKK